MDSGIQKYGWIPFIIFAVSWIIGGAILMYGFELAPITFDPAVAENASTLTQYLNSLRTGAGMYMLSPMILVFADGVFALIGLRLAYLVGIDKFSAKVIIILTLTAGLMGVVDDMLNATIWTIYQLVDGKLTGDNLLGFWHVFVFSQFLVLKTNSAGFLSGSIALLIFYRELDNIKELNTPIFKYSLLGFVLLGILTSVLSLTAEAGEGQLESLLMTIVVFYGPLWMLYAGIKIKNLKT